MSGTLFSDLISKEVLISWFFYNISEFFEADSIWLF